MTRPKTHVTGPVLAALTLMALSVGCVKRAEIIAVMPDGKVELVTFFNGDKDDVLGGSDPARPAGDPPPSSAAGWVVNSKDGKDGDKEKTTVAATMSLNAGAALPTTYADPNSAVASAATRFNTQIAIEERDNGTYYHFKRTYLRRRWAPFEFHRKQILESDNIKKLMENDPKTMSPADRKVVVDAMVAVETEQQIELLDMAISSVGNGVPQLAQLAATQQIREFTSQAGLGEKIMETLMSSNGAQNAPELEAKLHARIDAAVAKALTDAGTDHSIANATVEALQAARMEFQVSKDLEDDSWDVQVVLPGKVVAHNGSDEPETIEASDLDEPENKDSDDPTSKAAFVLAGKLRPFVDSPGLQNVSWSFKFDALQDRDVVLMASSFVPKK